LLLSFLHLGDEANGITGEANGCGAGEELKVEDVEMPNFSCCASAIFRNLLAACCR